MSAFRADDYWMKARLFVNRAMEPDEVRSEDERRLWASLALEILAKWALAATSPTLVADIKESGEQLFKAVGVRSGGPYVSVTASTAFKRCGTIYHPFKAEEATRFANARNEYLHGSEISLLYLPSTVWWSKYWSLVNVLLTAHEMEPRDLVGRARATEVAEHLARNAEWHRERTEAVIEAAKRNLGRHEAGTVTAAEARRWAAFTPGGGLRYWSAADCPACGSEGTVEAEEAYDAKLVATDLDYDDEPAVEVSISADYFSCEVCHLVLEDYDMITAAGMETEYTAEGELSDYYQEPEYGND